MYVYTQDVPIDFATYQRIIEALGPEPLKGALLHLCVRRPDGGLRYIDVWETQAACTKAFQDRIHPAVDAVFGGGGRPGTEPTVDHYEVLHATGEMLDRVAAVA